MEKVLDAGAGDKLRAVGADDVPTLGAVAREGARPVLGPALEAEVARYIEARRRGAPMAAAWSFGTVVRRRGG